MKKTFCLWLAAVLLTAGASVCAAQEPVPEMAPPQNYEELADRFRDVINDETAVDKEEVQKFGLPGETGVREAVGILGQRARYDLGCAILDVTGDGTPEFILGVRSGSSEENLSGEILAVYTLNGGRLELAFEGWYRNNYRYLGRGRFLYQGADSAAVSGRGVFTLTPDGLSRVWEKFYFTCPDPNGSGKILVYANKSGSWDPAQSEPGDIPLEQLPYWQSYAVEEELPLQPFFDGAEGLVTEVFVGEPEPGRDYETITLDDGPYARSVLVWTEFGVEELTLLQLRVEEFHEDGTLVFSAAPIRPLPMVQPHHPVALRLTFPGDLPFYGLAYRDRDGQERCFGIQASGRDDSLFLSEVKIRRER